MKFQQNKEASLYSQFLELTLHGFSSISSYSWNSLAIQVNTEAICPITLEWQEVSILGTRGNKKIWSCRQALFQVLQVSPFLLTLSGTPWTFTSNSWAWNFLTWSVQTPALSCIALNFLIPPLRGACWNKQVLCLLTTVFGSQCYFHHFT